MHSHPIIETEQTQVVNPAIQPHIQIQDLNIHIDGHHILKTSICHYPIIVLPRSLVHQAVERQHY